MKLKRDLKTWPKRRKVLLRRKRNIIPWKICADCKMPGTVVRGTIREQFATGGQFHCYRCGGTNLELDQKLAREVH
jgi:hypothetical protein